MVLPTVVGTINKEKRGGKYDGRGEGQIENLRQCGSVVKCETRGYLMDTHRVTACSRSRSVSESKIRLLYSASDHDASRARYYVDSPSRRVMNRW